MKKHYIIFLVPVVLTMLVIAGIAVARQRSETKHNNRLSPSIKRDSAQLLQDYQSLLSNPLAPSFGPKDAAVTVVEFLDFQCPYCGANHEDLMRLMSTYQESSVRFEFRQFPITSIHPHAVPAAQAALCSHEQGRYLDMQNIMFTRQDDIKPEAYTPWAAELGMNLAQFNTCLAEKKYHSVIKKDLSDAQSLGIQGTPTWFINGERVVGQISYEEMTAIIDDYLGRSAASQR
ncbi:DsbA family protein [Candidatus Uhrbacteria bacterium]|nr:DsbA family protein [Candidatus Uhrbacteria bacterium]